MGGCDPLREPETCIVLEQTSAKAKTVQSVGSKWLSSGSHKQNTASSKSKFKHVCLYDSHRATDWKCLKLFLFHLFFIWVFICNFIFSFCFSIIFLFSFIFHCFHFFFVFCFSKLHFFHFKHHFFISNFILFHFKLHFFIMFFSFSFPVAPEIQENHEKQWKTMENHQKQRKMKKKKKLQMKKTWKFGLKVADSHSEPGNLQKLEEIFIFFHVFSFFFHFPCPWHLKSRKAMKNNEKQWKTIKNKGK